MGFFKEYEVIVVGAGHAGCEAAHAAGKMGSKTLLITLNMNNIAQMSCNPAVGGIAKGQIVREIDALGGIMGIVTDETMIQSKMLNRSKGPAMWSPRAQSDRMMFSNSWRFKLEQNKNVDFWQDMVTDVLVSNDKIIGVKTQLGLEFGANSVVLTNGTFLNGKIHIGEKNFGGGRAAERASIGLTASLEKFGFESGRMKTGTPPRVDGRSLDFNKMEEQPGDELPGKFSFFNDTNPLNKQKSCFITYTNDKTHEILRSGFERSPLFNGAIKSLGPRYCPSIEDKINRFSHRPRHQIFAEPEGWNTIEFYINGFSSSLPEEIQLKSMQTIPGFENAKMFRPGYAVEYDYFPPTQLKHSLETKLIENLFFSGQINGTTGYEEAAGQGLIAGINAHLKTKGKDPLILSRDQAYIGVLIDDLITKGTDEPYRMFTSRAEYRILLRQDNADLRLSKIGKDIGLLSDEKYNRVQTKIKESDYLMKGIKKTSLVPEKINPLLKEKKSKLLTQKVKAISVLSRPNININDVVECSEELQIIKEKLTLKKDVLEQTEINIKYNGYIQREKENADKLKRLEHVSIPDDINYFKFSSLSTESKEKLSAIKPINIGQAARISGIKPSDISILLIYLGR